MSNVKTFFALPHDVLEALEQQIRPQAAGGLGKSQAEVAQELGISAPVVNALLRSRYTARTDKLAERIRGQYMKATVQCPYWGEISTRQCQDERSRPAAITWLQREVAQACRTCPHNPNRRG
jgi:hypothetical protein